MTLILCALGAGCDIVVCVLQQQPIKSLGVDIEQEFGWGIIVIIAGLFCFVATAVLFIIDCLTCGGKALSVVGSGSKDKKKGAEKDKALVAV